MTLLTQLSSSHLAIVLRHGSLLALLNHQDDHLSSWYMAHLVSSSSSSKRAALRVTQQVVVIPPPPPSAQFKYRQRSLLLVLSLVLSQERNETRLFRCSALASRMLPDALAARTHNNNRRRSQLQLLFYSVDTLWVSVEGQLIQPLKDHLMITLLDCTTSRTVRHSFRPETSTLSGVLIGTAPDPCEISRL